MLAVTTNKQVDDNKKY